MPIQLGDINLYSLKEIAPFLKVNILTLRRYIREERLKGQKVGRQSYVTEESLEKVLLLSSGDSGVRPLEVGKRNLITADET